MMTVLGLLVFFFFFFFCSLVLGTLQSYALSLSFALFIDTLISMFEKKTQFDLWISKNYLLLRNPRSNIWLSKNCTDGQY